MNDSFRRNPFAQSLPSLGTTLEAHIMAGFRGSPGATGEFSSLLNAIGLAVRIVHTRVRAAGLAGMLGYTGETNVQNEAVQKLDAFANEVLCAVLERSGRCAALVSEELDEKRMLSQGGKYIVCLDPLDGSSNIDVNISIGTIFSILRARTAETRTVEPALQPGRRIVAAGYAIYGSATTLVLSSGQGVQGFTLDPGVGEFFLSHPDIRCPERGTTYSINEGNSSGWSDEVRKWNAWIKANDKAEQRPYTQRYVGSLVADAHRTLLKGGIFAYPADAKNPEGKLRLLYEANPVAYLFEQAGGSATNGTSPILDIEPKKLHDRTPVVLGSAHDVGVYREFMLGER
ncbi:MAG TPA: class 1 fructose-bisphosphatase [Polyangiaceae bacterium]|jgi:fructose-1,6-bisphosphatase I|nr:class 1 fructose-bisphosphatase [Polyangiaceae bacterium]